MKNLVLKFELTLNFLKSIYTGSNIYMYPTNIWFNVLLQVAPQLDTFGSHQQLSGKRLAVYMTTLQARQLSLYLICPQSFSAVDIWLDHVSSCKFHSSDFDFVAGTSFTVSTLSVHGDVQALQWTVMLAFQQFPVLDRLKPWWFLGS